MIDTDRSFALLVVPCLLLLILWGVYGIYLMSQKVGKEYEFVDRCEAEKGTAVSAFHGEWICINNQEILFSTDDG